MRVYCCDVRCRSGKALQMLVVCAGKEHVAPIVDAIAFPEYACELTDVCEVETPAAYIVAEQP